MYQVWEVMAASGRPSGNPTRPRDGCSTGVVPGALTEGAVLRLTRYAVDVALRWLAEWKRETPG